MASAAARRRRAVRCNEMFGAGARLADEAVVLGVRADPEPYDSITAVAPQCTVRKANTDRPQLTDLFQVER